MPFEPLGIWEYGISRLRKLRRCKRNLVGVLDALKESPPQSTIVMIPALNQMIDITTTRAIAALTHTPILVFTALIALTLACALLAGFVMAGSTTRHMGFHSVDVRARPDSHRLYHLRSRLSAIRSHSDRFRRSGV